MPAMLPGTESEPYISICSGCAKRLADTAQHDPESRTSAAYRGPVALDAAASLIEASRMDLDATRTLRAAYVRLENVESLLAGDPSTDADRLKLDAFMLRGIIARDNFWEQLALHWFALARQSARALDDRNAMVAIALSEASASLAVGHPERARRAIANAERCAQELLPPKRRVAKVEILARQAALLEIRRQYAQVVYIFENEIIPISGQSEREGLQAARLVTLARAKLQLGDLDGAEVLLQRAEPLWQASGKRLREAQWRSVLSAFLDRAGDSDEAEREAEICRRLLLEGQFRHRYSERVLDRWELELPPQSNVLQGPPKVVVMNANHHYDNKIYGGQVVQGSSDFSLTQQVGVSIDEGDQDALLNAMRDLGLGDPALAELKASVEEDAIRSDSHASLLSWKERWLPRLWSATGKVAAGTLAGVATQALDSYMGLHP